MSGNKRLDFGIDPDPDADTGISLKEFLSCRYTENLKCT